MSKSILNPVRGSAAWLPTDRRERSAPLKSALLGESLYNAVPFRKGHQYPRQRNVHGHYWCASTGRHVWHESLLERSSMMLLDHPGDIVAMASPPMKLTVGDWWHVPDFIVLHRDGTQTVVDVKPSSLMDERARAQFEQTADICRQVGWNYRVLTERSSQVRVNLEFLGQFRHEERQLDDGCLAAVAAFEPGWTLGELFARVPAASAGDARAKAMRVLWDRELVVDLSQRLSDDSPLSVPAVFGLEAVDGTR